MELFKNRPPAAAAVPRVPAGERWAQESSRAQVSTLRGMNALERHRHFMAHYASFYGPASNAPAAGRTDLDVVRDEHRFLWDARDGDGDRGLSWEQRLARRYHDKLFKEYALADMSRYREGQVGLRWRTEAEVFDGKGQFVCGNKRCTSIDALASFELNFAYVEHGERRQALVKLRVCPRCERKLHYRQLKERKRAKRQRDKEAGRKKKKKRKKKEEGSSKAEKRARRRDEGSGRARESDEGSGSSSDDESDAERPPGGDAPAATTTAADAPDAGATAGDEVWLSRPAADKTEAEEFDEYFDAFCAPLLV